MMVYNISNISVGMQDAPLPCSDVEVNQASESLILNLILTRMDLETFKAQEKSEHNGPKTDSSVSRLHFCIQLLGASIF
jgi:hypothetical protein